MSTYSMMPAPLRRLCDIWSKDVEAISGAELRMQYFKGHLPELLLNRSVFVEILKNITKGKPYPDIKRTEAFDNEILLFLHPKRIFSLRIFLFGPGEFTPIHDHNSWGVIGTALNRLTVVNYKREDDGTREGFAKIKEYQRITLEPGDTQTTLSLDQGIHATGSAADDPVIMVNIYGNPIRRIYINRFDPVNNRVEKLYAPRLKKRIRSEGILSTLLSPN